MTGRSGQRDRTGVPLGRLINGRLSIRIPAMNTVLTLASNSPRRKELIAFGGWTFKVTPVEIDESPFPGEEPLEYVRRMAHTKAMAAAGLLPPGSVAVTADTTVADMGKILGKPADKEEAIAMLKQLRGRSHQVHTAIGVIRPGDDEPIIDLCTTDVPMRSYTDTEIMAYVDSGDPFDKAGGYAIQHTGFRPVDHLTGCYANVVGLPVCHLVRTLKKWGIEPQADIPANCRNVLGYTCTAYQPILESRA